MNYPLILKFDGTVFGKGFVAEITATGRLLAEDIDTDEWWLYGVNPGAIAEVGASLEEAHCALRAALRQIVIDLAAEAGSFDAFNASVRDFFLTANKAAQAEWLEAVGRVRTTKERLADLPVRPAEEPFVFVKEKDLAAVTPRDNTITTTASLVAKAA